MSEYNFREIEPRWQACWRDEGVYRVKAEASKPKFYVLDMFPYPSGAGLHVGHPLGYIASDIVSRYKRQCGFNVLHPMGFDAFGLPAEQYAIQTGQHPAATTEQNIARYREQLDKMGFSYDTDREIRTCDPGYYKWTQWVFLKLFNHYYDAETDKAQPIEKLVARFEKENPAWRSMTVAEREEVLQNYRLAFRAETTVNWCAALGTVLANDEVVGGVSVRGGHPVEQRRMKQWLLRVTAYAERMLDGLNRIDWSESLKEIQRNWIGRSEGAQLFFDIEGHEEKLEIFTTRPDTIEGVTFMVLAPEHDLVPILTTDAQREAVGNYLSETKKRSERERMSETRVSGAFTGAYATNPATKKRIPVYISDYVLAGYGTGAIMAVPAHDERDGRFAEHFGLEVIPLTAFNEYPELGTKVINYRLRDAIFSRQRYWGEPIPIYYKDGVPCALDEKLLPLELPPIDNFGPTEDGEPPLARVKNWQTKEGYPLELSTMPGFAGSCAYALRYMDPHNDKALVDRTINDYWRDVDLYVGGIEHATGHLMYSRFWNMFLYDIGVVCEAEPFKRLVNQGMIQGRSSFVYRIVDGSEKGKFVSHGLREQYKTQEIHVDISLVHNDVLDTAAFKAWRPEFSGAEFILEGGKYTCGWAVEKMSKSMFNVVNPDQIIADYGADTLRMYEMFLGPLTQSKPWDTNGIDGVSKFLRRFWNLFPNLEDTAPTEAELRTLHKTIKKVRTDIENFSFNTAVSAFMICLNELGACHKRAILEPLTVLLSPFAPHITEELWHAALGHTTSICEAEYPDFDEKYLQTSSFEYPVSVNGKLRFHREYALSMTPAEIEKEIVATDEAQKHLNGAAPKKVIVVAGKIINIVI